MWDIQTVKLNNYKYFTSVCFFDMGVTVGDELSPKEVVDTFWTRPNGLD